jgi:hypothetical protein
MNDQRYRYHRMDDPSHQIRLVSIGPRQNRKRIHLELELVSINDVEGQYEAVSYMWGPPSPERRVIVNGKALILRDNIWRCLKHLRDHKLTGSRLWIDSICINQNDTDERTQQVAKMAQIFKHASRVLIWLGSTSLQTYLLAPGTEILQDSIETLPSKDWDAWFDVLGHSDPRSWSLQNQIMSVVYNTYWGRLWIVQEAALARNACIIFGKALLDKDCIIAMYMAARENSKPGYRSWIARQRDPNIRDSGTGSLDHHPMMRASQNKGSVQEFVRRDSLSELIEAYHWKGCTDPRDYVFGLVGLLDPCPRLEISYSSSNEEVAIKALHYLGEEGAQGSSHQMGLNLSAAAALLKALTVTNLTYQGFEQKLPPDKAQAMQAKSLHLLFRPMMILTTDNSVSKPDIAAYEDVFELNVSGRLMKKLHLIKREDGFELKLLNGQIKRFNYARDSNQLTKERNVVLLCSLHILPAVIVRWNPNDDRTIQVEHFIFPDMTRQPYESTLDIEIQLPTNVRDALQREINACGVNWNDIYSDTSSHSFLHLSTLEVISICELIAPKAIDVAEL